MAIDNLHRHILHYAAAAIQICLPIIMDVLPSVTSDEATAGEASKPQAKKWSEQETEDLVDFLCKNRSETNSPGNFKPTIWTAAKKYLDSKHPDSPRTIAAIKSKFTTFKDMYRVVEDYYGRSGMGAMPIQSGIWAQTDAERQIYDEFEKNLGRERKKYCRQLLNTPFRQYEKLQMIMEKSIAKGRFAHKGTAHAPSNPSTVDDVDDDTAGHAVPNSSSSTMISPAIQEHTLVNNSASMDLDDPVLPSMSSGLPPPGGLSSLSVPSASATTQSSFTPASVSSPPSASVSSPPPASASVPSVKSTPSVKSAKSKTSEKRKRASEDDPTPDQPLSKQPSNASKPRSTAGLAKTNTSLSALIGATGTINNLNTTMQQSLFQSDARRIELAMELIKDVNYIDDNDKGALSFYYSNNPNAAGSLVTMSDTQRENTLRYALQMIQRQAPF